MPSEAETTELQVRCSFCGKPSTEVAKVIAGPGVYICDECVGLCQDILEREKRQSPTSADELPSYESLSEEEKLDLLPRMAAVGAQSEASLQRLVTELRGRNVTWTRIGAALEITRQSAWERFSGEE
jgi:hypothetical protein